jgi:hypothetical protein
MTTELGTDGVDLSMVFAPLLFRKPLEEAEQDKPAPAPDGQDVPAEDDDIDLLKSVLGTLLLLASSSLTPATIPRRVLLLPPDLYQRSA